MERSSALARARRASLVVLAFGVLAVRPAAAQDSYYPYPLGLRTAGMGGAASAFGSDSAMAWWNPAGIANSRGQTFGASANGLVIDELIAREFTTLSPDTRRIQGALAEDGASRIDGRGVSVFPTSASYSVPFGDRHFLAFSVMIPYARLDNVTSSYFLNGGAGLSIDRYTDELRSLKMYHFGPSYAVKLADTVRLGGSLMLRYAPFDKTFSSEQSSHAFFTRDVFLNATEQTISAASWDLDASVGAQLGPFAGFSFGVAVHSPNLHIGGSYEEQTRTFIGNSNRGEVSTISGSRSGDSYDMKSPLWFDAGVGFEIPGVFALAADVSVWLPLDRYQQYEVDNEEMEIRNDPASPGTITTSVIQGFIERELVVNVHVGAEVTVSDKIILRGGFFTDFSAIPDFGPLAERSSFQVGRRRIDRLGATAGLAYSGQTSQFQAGFVFLGGIGQVVGEEIDLVNPQFPDREIAANTYMLAISGELDATSLLDLAQGVAREELGLAPEAPAPDLGPERSSPAAASAAATTPPPTPPPTPPGTSGPRSTEDARVSTANEHLAAGRLDQAIEVARSTQSAEGRAILARAHQAKGQIAEAIGAWKAAAAKAPGEPAYLISLATLLKQVGLTEELEQTLAEGRRRFPRHAAFAPGAAAPAVAPSTPEAPSAPAPSSPSTEHTEPLCADGKDNDDNGRSDCAETACQSFLSCKNAKGAKAVTVAVADTTRPFGAALASALAPNVGGLVTEGAWRSALGAGIAAPSIGAARAAEAARTAGVTFVILLSPPDSDTATLTLVRARDAAQLLQRPVDPNSADPMAAQEVAIQVLAIFEGGAR